MKRITLIIFLITAGIAQHASGQRFLTRVFPTVGSVPDVIYGHAPDYQGKEVALYFDFYEPDNDESRTRPLLIYAHGGGWTGGTRKGRSIKMMCEELAHRGYAVASISYRVDPRFDFFTSDTNRKVMTDAMHDMRAAIRFFKANEQKYRIDTSNIFVSGESAGAGTAMMVGYVNDSSELRAYPMTEPYNIEGNSGTPGPSSKVKGVLCLCGLIVDTAAIEAREPSLFWAHGSSDPIVPFSRASEIPERAEHIGLEYKKIVYEGATHCPWIYSLSNWQYYLDSVVFDMSHFMYSVITGKKAPHVQRPSRPLIISTVIQDNMVVQQDKPFSVWGTAPPGDTVGILADWLESPVNVGVRADGSWRGAINVPKAMPGNFDPHRLSVIYRNDTITFYNILIGDVWVCAGGANMNMPLEKMTGWFPGVLNYKEEIEKADYPAIRIFNKGSDFSAAPTGNSRGRWWVCSPKTAGNLSAVAYFFGQRLFQELNIPVGLVVVSGIGARGESFLSKEALLQDTLLKRVYWDPYKSDVGSQDRVDSLDFFKKVRRPTLIYNGMVHPLINLSVRGFIWYQGAANYADGDRYTHLITALVRSWRRDFNQGDLPFYFVQMAPYAKNPDKCPNILGLFWEAQERLLRLKNTGMALSMDVGEVDNVHPRNKKPVGVRLAKIALNKTYGRGEIAWQGPVLSKYRIKKDGKVELSFVPSTIASGLTTNDGKPPEHFSLAGKDEVFYPATARIAGDKVSIYSAKVPHPVAIRYGFTNDAITNLQNKEGLPALPFRTDSWSACLSGNGEKRPERIKAQPGLQVAGILQSNMVIQQDKPFRVWGTSGPGDTIFVRADWLQKPLRVYAGKDGVWSGTIKVPKAIPGNYNPRSIEIWNSRDTVKLSNLLIGEVWLCAGQSNMDMKVAKVGWYAGILDYEKAAASADYPAIRVFTQPSAFKVRPQRNTGGEWQVCSPGTAGNFSAVAYFFGRELYERLRVPVGLVVSAAAGASAQAFVPEKVLTADAVLKREYWDPYQSLVISQPGVDSLGFFEKVTKPTLIYNGMIHPLEQLSVRGIIWYQGESNYADRGNYTRLFSAVIGYWRQAFNQGTLPFYFTQIAPYAKNADKNPIILPLFWEAQQNTLKLKGTGMALTVDVGDTADVHPRNKRPVGERLAKIALNKTYGLRSILYRGPVFKKFTVDGPTVKIKYIPRTTGTGLTTNDGTPPRHFEVAGEDRVFHEATAKIAGSQVWIHADEVPHPVAVRYGFNNAAITNLENKEGLPAMPFRTDNWDK